MDSQYALGTIYLFGEGAAVSYEKAAEYFLLAAEQGHDRALNNLGFMCENGFYFEQSYEKAAEYYQLAAAQGSAAAMFNLGCLYREGSGVEQSDEMALYYLLLSADKGYDKAQEMLNSLNEKTE